LAGGGLLLPWLLQSTKLVGRQSGRRQNGRGLLISLLVLVGGYFLRRTLIEAGHSSSKNARH
jgi:formate-dependent nitrite reductase membrane component NrfD